LGLDAQAEGKAPQHDSQSLEENALKS
jgi:hypothetical protein